MASNSMTEQGLYDIYEQSLVPFWQTKLFYSICAILIFVVIGATLYFTIRLYRSKRAVLSPWHQALRDIEGLQKDNLAKASEGKRFYSILTSVLKKYVHRRYLMDGLAKTDQEFVFMLQKNNFDPELIEQLQTIFMGSVAIKFANAQALQEQIEKDLLLAKSFIKRTQPINKK